MTMTARVLEVHGSELLVLDLEGLQEVIVHMQTPYYVYPQDQISIEFDGIMTRSIPAQVVAREITHLSSCSCGHVHSL